MKAVIFASRLFCRFGVADSAFSWTGHELALVKHVASLISVLKYPFAREFSKFGRPLSKLNYFR